MTVVVVGGQKGSGKDTFYARVGAIAPSLGLAEPIVRVSFADKVKEYIAAMSGIPLEVLEANKNNHDTHITFEVGEWVTHRRLRQFMQDVPNRAREVLGDLLWVDMVWDKLCDHEGKIVVVTDFRFESEYHRLNELPTDELYFVQITDDAERNDPDISERPLPHAWFDAHIDNSVRDDGFVALDAQVEAFLKENLL